MIKRSLLFFLILFANTLFGQSFYFGADLSYVNEMEDCGVDYMENQTLKDPYTIFENHGCNLVRLRLWHTPAWYDNLNNGNRYSDLNDVKRSIARAKQNNLQVLLDFHLSDSWADPSKQLVPQAWLPIVDDVQILKDSLYNYIYQTLTHLNNENLLPELIQIGNETNKGILLSPDDNAVWTLDWERNAILFNQAIQAVEDFETATEKDIKTVLHVAGPDEVDWLIEQFISNGVNNFDIIGISYYWAWHLPTSIAQTGQIIQNLRNLYPDKEVMIVETGYIWTEESNDNANNIISESHPDYQPINPTNQREWLIDLTQEVIDSDGAGVIYWEPAWVSSNCFTQWGQGSHQEHAAFFDFDNNLLLPGGIEWMSFNYDLISSQNERLAKSQVKISANSFSGTINIFLESSLKDMNYSVFDISGNQVTANKLNDFETNIQLEKIPFGIYIVLVKQGEKIIKMKKVILRN